MLVNVPRGTKDILPKTIKYWHYLEEKIKNICRNYGYEEIRTPIFEHTELFQRGIGDTTDVVEKEMYTFSDRGDRSITLRPENTAAVVRSFVENKLYADNPLVKVYYVGPMFRYDRPQAGRYRQFHQFGVEAIGLPGPNVDVEIILLAISFLNSLGLKDLNLLINSVGCPTCRPVHKEALQNFLKDNFANLCSDCQRRFDKNPMRILDCKVPSCQKIIENAPSLQNYLCEECETHFNKLQELLKATNVNFTIDDKLVRGLDYYTKTAFEIQYASLGAQSAVCGGGRYDGLVEEVGGSATPGIGFAMGIERILLVLENQGLLPKLEDTVDTMIVYLGENAEKKAFEISKQLRARNISVHMDFLYRSMKAQMKQANKVNAKSVLILGDEELLNKKVTFKNMLTGEQESISFENIETIISKIEVEQ